MATVSTLSTGPRGVSNRGANPFAVAVDIDLAAATTAKGSDLAAADIIEAIEVQADVIVLAAGMTATTDGDGTGVVLDLGITGDDPDFWVDGFNWTAASAGDETVPAGTAGARKLGAGDTIDVLIQAASAAPAAGTLTVWALMVPYFNERATIEPDEVVRDQLA